MENKTFYVKESNDKTEALLDLGYAYFNMSDNENDIDISVTLFSKAIEVSLKNAKHGNISDLKKVVCFFENTILNTTEDTQTTPEEKVPDTNIIDVYSDSNNLHGSFWTEEEPQETEKLCAEDAVRKAKENYFGKNGEKNLFEARRLFELAAAEGSTEANKYLGYMCMKGLGGDSDYIKAENCLKEVISKGEEDYREESSTCLAELYATCLEDMPKAVEIWKELALKGNTDAQYNYGLALFKGIGTEPNPERGIFWWQNAAGKGHEDAKYNLEVLFGGRK